MKALKDMSWPHFKPTENLHAARSNPSLKASSTIYLHQEKANGNDQSFRRLSEGAYGPEEPIRELSPRPEPDSRTLTPEPAPEIRNPKPKTSIPTPEPYQGTIIPEFDSKELTPSASTKELNDPEIILPAILRDGKENIFETLEAQLSPSVSVSTKDLSASLKGLELAVTAMGLRGSGSISPLSDGSIDDLIQSMPDSPVSEHPPGSIQADFKWKTSKKITRIDVSESSMDEPLNTYLPLSNASNAVSTFPTIQTVTSNHPVVVVPEMAHPTFDGPASIANITKDFSHGPGDCPIISEANESQGDTDVPLKIESHTKIIPGPLIADNRLSPSTVENIAMADSNSLKYKLPGAAPDIPAVPVPPVPTGAPDLPGLPQISTIPGLPVDATGLASAPTMPASNLNKKQKMKVKGQKAIRKGRRLVMRKSVLTVLLGRQVAGLTIGLLRIVSRGGGGAVDAATNAGLVQVPSST